MDENDLLAKLLADDDEEEFQQLTIQTLLHITPTILSANNRQGSVPGHAYINRGRQAGHHQLYQDYFAENPTYPLKIFRRRFRMRRPLFLHVVEAIQNHDNYFIQKRNAAGVLGFSSLQKVTAALRQLAFGAAADAADEYVRIGESTAIETLRRFCMAVEEVFGEEYLRAPTNKDVAQLLAVGEARGWPGMLGSLDCMHWTWKNCPTAWQGQYTGKEKEPTIILEAVASYDLWIWHAFFGMPGSHNDINVLDRSPLFTNLVEGRAAPVNFTVNGHHYKYGYYLADGIYPPWSTIVQSISQPQGNKKKLFATRQEAARKDVERAFGVLQARFAIIAQPARCWSQLDLGHIMKTCIILHNMIIEDERDENLEVDYDAPLSHLTTLSHEHTADFDAFLKQHHHLRDHVAHYQLRDDLMEHLWELEGEA